MISEYQKVLADLQSIRRFGRKKSLIPLKKLLATLGDPQTQPAFIHVAGTNGKGSTAATTASILASTGLRVGLYTSPYLQRFTERIRVLSGREGWQAWQTDESAGEISPETVVELWTQVKQAAQTLSANRADPAVYGWELTFFEGLSAMAFLHFKNTQCDVVVLETGLGGRLDATNVIDHAAVTGLTSLHYDHCECLGSSLAQIAAEKAAIIKPQTVVVGIHPQASGLPQAEVEAARQVIQNQATKQAVVYYELPPVAQLASLPSEPLKHLQTGQRFRLAPLLKAQVPPSAPDLALPVSVIETPLLGDHQRGNIHLALYLSTVYMRQIGLSDAQIERALQEGTRATRWPARLEILQREPLWLLDGAHNPQGAQVFSQAALGQLKQGQRPSLLCGFLRDKVDEGFIKVWADEKRWGPDGDFPLQAIHVVSPDDSPRSLLPTEIQSIWQSTQGIPAWLRQCPIHLHASIEAAMTCLLSPPWSDQPVLIYGSLYLAGAVRTAWKARKNR